MVKKNTSCSACGTGYVNHTILYTTSLLEETLEKYGDVFFNFVVRKNPQKITVRVEKIIFSVLSMIGILKFNTDIEKASTGRSKLIWEEARRRGIQMEQLVLWRKHIEYYRAHINGNIFYFQSLPIPISMPQDGYKWLDDKFTLFKRLSTANIPIPATKKVSTWNGTLKAFDSMKKPLIIKPKLGSRGRHTTTNIHTVDALKEAYKLVNQITASWVVQEHLSGSVCRATIINGELVGFFRAEPPQITGDSVHTIKELIVEKNQKQPENLSAIEINADLLSFIKRLGFTLESKPKKGELVNLSAKTGRLYGGYTEEMLPKVHPKMHSIFKEAGNLMQAPVVGFDLIIEDPTVDPDLVHWGIIECNSLPFIDLHYLALTGPRINLAEKIWDFWDTTKK